MVMASKNIGAGVIKKLCQRVLGGEGLPEEWGCDDGGEYKGVKLLELLMKIVDRVLENRIRGFVKFNDVQFGFMLGKGTIHALFVLRRMQEKFRGRKKKLYMCFVNLEKAFSGVPRKVMEWTLRKKGLPEVLVQAVMSFEEGLRKKVRVASKLSEDFGVRVGARQRYVVLSPVICAIVVDVVTEVAREGSLYEVFAR